MKAFLLLIINFFVFFNCDDINVKSNIKCFEGEGLSQRNWDKKECESAKWCMKLADDDNSNEDRTCDEGNICQQIGNKCDSDMPNVITVILPYHKIILFSFLVY
uniref:Uncharacterized protein n=1 Tax=Panagrolaimus sp. PS1159 TaxID=55785 RepID=A0AC35GNN7_9BILA